jgi:quercetin dioxygenase-like cupin family protein
LVTEARNGKPQTKQGAALDQQGGYSTGLKLTRRRLLGVGVSGGMGLWLAAGPGPAQTRTMNDATDWKKGTMDIRRNGSRPSTRGPEDYFTGSVRVDPVFQVGDPVRLNAGNVTFEPGARTAWHTHPLGQTLIIMAGLGWVQTEGGPIEEVRPGDVVWFPPGEKHWHGATPTTSMTHIAVQESFNGKAVDWMEKVSDAQYRR